ncbi:hypothetical protein EGW08_007557 [Elysia chlorotica]|uniref:G-protein coupled receptors family 1 profile domain-containing protein n=1 Tax=Elysia chlorotica TaxID=188477 RepID=A0A433TSY8_ELYCH|nr:hypothetical protein EGW08_007557 [Elysia chlorotica]
MFAVGELIHRENTSGDESSFTHTNNTNSTTLTNSDSLTASPNTSHGGCTYKDFSSSKFGLNYAVISVGVVLILQNSLLIFVIARNARLHTNTNLLVASLAVTDVLMGVQCFVVGITGLGVGARDWLATLGADLHVFDIMILSINLALVGVSLLHVVCLAVDRYLFLLWPFRYRNSVTRARIMALAAVIWTLGVLYALLPLVLFNDSHHRRSCLLSEAPVSFGYVPIGCVYLVCLVVVTYCTRGMVKLARQHRRGRVRKHTRNLGSKLHSAPDKSEVVLTVYRIANNNLPNMVEKDIYTRPDNVEQTDVDLNFSSPEVPITNKSQREFKDITSHFANVKGSHANKRILDNNSKNQLDSTTMEVFKVSEDVNNQQNYQHNTVLDGKTRLFNKSNIKILKFVLVVFGTFLAFTFPEIALLSLIKLFHLSLFNGDEFAFDVLHFMITINSGMNFLTITYMNKDFRRALLKSLPFCTFCFRTRNSK